MLVALGAIAALVIWALTARRASPPPTDAGTTSPPAPAASAPAPAPAPSAAAPASRPASPRDDGAARTPAAAAAGADGLTVAEAQLCTSLSSNYRCDAAGSTVRPGRLVFYTRLIATRNTSVVHRWYRGSEVRQSVRLDVPARRQGFRTFSRSTVSASDGDWRVELRNADGKILHTERFTVR